MSNGAARVAAVQPYEQLTTPDPELGQRGREHPGRLMTPASEGGVSESGYIPPVAVLAPNCFLRISGECRSFSLRYC
jgi:hypothetical protein